MISIVIITKNETYPPYLLSNAWIESNLRIRPADIRLFRVPSNEMSPTLEIGDTVLIDISQPTPAPPGIFLFFDGESVSIRRLESIRSGKKRYVRIMPDNSAYTPAECTPDDLLVIGRAVWVSHAI